MCMAASIFIEGNVRPYGHRLCTPDLMFSNHVIVVIFYSDHTSYLPISYGHGHCKDFFQGGEKFHFTHSKLRK